MKQEHQIPQNPTPQPPLLQQTVQRGAASGSAPGMPVKQQPLQQAPSHPRAWAPGVGAVFSGGAVPTLQHSAHAHAQVGQMGAAGQATAGGGIVGAQRPQAHAPSSAAPMRPDAYDKGHVVAKGHSQPSSWAAHHQHQQQQQMQMQQQHHQQMAWQQVSSTCCYPFVCFKCLEYVCQPEN